jgi:protein Tex
MANRYIKSPYDVVAVGDVITVWVMEVKPGEKKISLSMIPPGQERRAGGRFGGPPRGHIQETATPHPQATGERPQLQPRSERPPFQRGAPTQGPGAGRFGRGPGGPGGRGPGGPPRPGPGVPQGQPSGGGGGAQPPTSAPPPKPRPPAKSKPLPNLTAEKKSGKAALNTFAELAAFFKKEEPKPEPSPPPPEEPKPAPITPEAQASSEPKSEASADGSKPTEGQPPA